MLRRTFLKYTSLAAAAALLPSHAQAAGAGSYTGPLWIFVQATGGWDPTSFCDPKGYFEEDDGNGGTVREANPMNNSYANADIATTSTGISYAPISGADDNNQQYAFATFFEKFKDKLLVINGVDAQTNGHDSGRRYLMSGRLAEGYPALSALIAGVNLPSSPLAFITAGGYDETDGVVAGTRADNTGTLNEIAYVNRYNNDTNYTHPSVFERIRLAREARIERLIGKQQLEGVRAVMNQFNLAHTGSNELAKLVEYIPADLNTHPDRNNQVFSQGRFAMAGYKAGLTTSVNVAIGGFDTHGNHDNNHIPRLARLLKGIDLLQTEAEAQGIADNVVFVVGSDFGRTPRYNAGNGKDHWSVSSIMVMGKGVRGGRVIGETTHGHEAKALNLTTLAVDEVNGTVLTYGHVNLALRKLAAVHNNAMVQQYYPLDNTIESVDLFS